MTPRENALQILVKTVGDVTVLEFTGKLDTQTSPSAQEQVTGLIEKGARKILMNLEKLDYIASAGLRVFLAANKQLEPDGGELRICSLTEIVKEVFEITGFVTILQVYESESGALEGF